MTQWIDFKALRASLRFADVLQSYGVNAKLKGDKATAFCPLPTHDGKKHSPSFSANLERGIWQCFGCGAKGNLLDFACLMEGFDPTDPKAFREAALVIQKRFGKSENLFPSDADEPVTAKRRIKAPAKQEGVKQAASDDEEKPRKVNEPLDFELKDLDPDHLHLKQRGFTKESILHFGLGFCSRGMLAGRIAIPLHDAAGQLVGYAGRIVDDKKISTDCPKYLFPGDRERKGVLHLFRKSLLLYNDHRLQSPLDDLIVVEGFASVWWLWQAGFKNVVALMGASCSDTQAALMNSMMSSKGRVWIISDGDDAGRRAAISVLTQVASQRFVRWVPLEAGRQPTDHAPEELRTLMRFVKSMHT